MRPDPALTVAALVIVLLGIGTATRRRRRPADGLHGVVADASGGVLPGVTVVAASEDGRVLATGVTDEVGRYAFDALPAASVRLTFQLEGFSTAIVDVTIGGRRRRPGRRRSVSSWLRAPKS